MISAIIILTLSALLFISGWVFTPIYNCIEKRKSQREYERRIEYQNQNSRTNQNNNNTLENQRQIRIDNKQNSDRQVINENENNI